MMTKAVVTSGAIRRAKTCQNVTTNKPNTQFLYRPAVIPVAQPGPSVDNTWDRMVPGCEPKLHSLALSYLLMHQNIHQVQLPFSASTLSVGRHEGIFVIALVTLLAVSVRTLWTYKGIRPVKNWVLVCWWWWFDWSFARHIAPLVTITSVILSSNKIQNEDILVPANTGPPGKWSLNRRQHSSSTTTKYSRYTYNYQEARKMFIAMANR